MASFSASSACSSMACEMAPCCEEILGAQVGLVGELLVVDGFQVGVEGVGDVRALHFEEQLAFFHVVVEAGLDVDHAAVGQRDDGNLAGDVGKDGAGGVQLGGGLDLSSRGERELGHVVVVDGDQVHVGHLDDLGWRRRAIALLLALAAAREPRHNGAARRRASASIRKLLEE